MTHCVVFTGGPGSGKTSVLEALQKSGYRTKSEVGRKVIQQEVAKGSDSVPWANKQRFASKMLKKEVNALATLSNEGRTVFFDRSVIDVYGYCQLETLLVSRELLHQCSTANYIKTVFMFPPWQAIYQNDEERKQGFDTAVDTYRAMIKAYSHFGYQPIEMSLNSVEERMNFVLDRVKRVD